MPKQKPRGASSASDQRRSREKAKPDRKRITRARRKNVARSHRSASPGQLGEPASPMPAQHQQKPGLESKMTSRPGYAAPYYKVQATYDPVSADAFRLVPGEPEIAASISDAQPDQPA